MATFAGDTLTTMASNFFKTRFSDYLGSHVMKASAVTAMIDKMGGKPEILSGASLNTTWAHKKGNGVGSAVLAEGGNYADALPTKSMSFTLAMTHLQFTVEWTGHVEAAGSSDAAGWYGDIVKMKSQELRDEATKTVARYAYHDGTSVLAQITNVATNVLTITGCPIHFFEIGQKITVRDGLTGGTEQLTNAATGAGVITDVDYENSTITVADGSGAAATTDYIAWSGHYDLTVPNGIRNLVDSAGTVQGVNRATAGNSPAKAFEITTTAALSSDLIDQVRDRVEDVASLRGRKYSSVWMGNRKTRRWGSLATIGSNRFANLDLTLGVDAIKIGDKDGRKVFVEDPMIVDAELYAVSFEKFFVGHPEGQKGGYARKNGNSVFFPKSSSTAGGTHADGDLMYWIWRGNFGCRDFICQAKTTGFVEP